MGKNNKSTPSKTTPAPKISFPKPKAKPTSAPSVKAESTASGNRKSKLKGKASERAPSPSPENSEEENEHEPSFDDDEHSGDSEDEDGVDEEGMARLMKALGEDGLDELGKAQLRALDGADEAESENGHDSEVERASELDAEKADEELGGEDESEDEEDIVEATATLFDESTEDGEEEDGDIAVEPHDIPMDEASSVDEDAIPRQKIEIDNKAALEKIRESIKLDSSFSWTETLVLSYPNTIDVDVDDDLNRELAFYKQALHSAQQARTLAAKQNPPFPFTRPSDYFAEMVKSDSHMERIRMRLLNESSTIKKSEEKRKEREGKKFGKQVQIEKLKERERSKKEMDEKLKALKRKRKDVLDKPREDDEEFDIAVEDAISERPAKRGKGPSGKSIPRSVRDKKYGFGGAGRHAKQNTRESTNNFDPSKVGSKKAGKGGGPKGRHKTKRLGKSRRMTARSKS